MTIYLLCARQHDSFRAIRAYRSRSQAMIFARLGDDLERKIQTKQLIEFARSTKDDDERDQWGMEILRVVNDGVRYWKHFVDEVEL